MKTFTTEELSTLDVLAYHYLRYGQAERACTYLRFLTEICPDSARFHRSYALALLLNENTGDALQFAKISLNLAKSPLDRTASCLILCFIFHKLNDPLEAKANRERFILERKKINN